MSKGFQSPGGSVASDNAPQAEAVPVRVLATVHVLPGAAQLAVMQPRWRGRYPQCIAILWHARNRRLHAAEAEAVATLGCRDAVASLQAHLRAARRRHRGLSHALSFLPLAPKKNSPDFEARAVLAEEVSQCEASIGSFLAALSALGGRG